MMENNIPRMLTINEAASMFNLPRHFIRQLCISGQFVTVRAGKKYLLNAARFADFLNGPPAAPQRQTDGAIRAVVP